MHDLNDTIAAIATAPGEAGLGVVRVSGSSALRVADVAFRGGGSLAAAPSHTLHHGWVEAADGTRVDEVVAAIFRAPRSYTREDVVELSCHGGASAAKVLAALLEAGARLARPGEFTLRAFLHGRIDLAQAEAVADVIHAETEGARQVALAQLAGELSRRLAAVRAPLDDLLAEVEARVDFAEDVGGVEIPTHAVEGIAAADAALAALLEGATAARAMREGVRVPLIGAPNAGKSSLFNALVGEERAIVTPEPGTTRDRVSEPVELAGVRVVLSDTAGVREAAQAVEAIGVARSRELLDESPLVVWVVDGAKSLEAGDREIAARLGGGPEAAAVESGHAAVARRVVVALNKSDLPGHVTPAEISRALNGTEHRVVTVSARTGEGVETLRDALTKLAGGGAAGAVSNARHLDALSRARTALARASEGARTNQPGEIVATDLREALGAIGEVTGQSVAEDLLDRIFARFCVGK